jgi:hypothetical protein
VDSLFAWMEGTAIAAWTRESPSLWAYPSILTLHSFGLGIVVGGSFAIDLRLLGWARGIPLAALTPVIRIIWWAFAVNAASGLLLFMADATTKATQPVFLLKLACIALALLVTAAIARRMRHAPDVPIGPLLPIASLLLWLGAITAGRLMAYA